MKTHNDFLKIAIDIATKNVENGIGGPFGAVIVRNGEIIATGNNKVTYSNDPTAHAEIIAIRNACRELETYQLNDCEIYSSCEPCPMCLGAIYWARPKALYFAANKYDASNAGFDDSFIYKEIKLDITKRQILTKHINLHERLKPFEAWKVSNSKIEY